ncbi:hypothetical protein WJX72_005813 [[Myrmecia] bisecta]|uniref:Uncharacterized protein n=1 Tax=[Myrmecia] bisecta TaxID=41462 RepID=A0AAW1QQV3_9CHLO
MAAIQPSLWKGGLFGCFGDCGTCIYGFCCLPCMFGENSSKIRNSGCFGPCLLYYCCSCFACIFAGNLRGEIRGKYNLPEEPCSDCCVHFWCSPCGVCQEARHIAACGNNPQGAMTMQQTQMTAPHQQQAPQY